MNDIIPATVTRRGAGKGVTETITTDRVVVCPWALVNGPVAVRVRAGRTFFYLDAEGVGDLIEALDRAQDEIDYLDARVGGSG